MAKMKDGFFGGFFGKIGDVVIVRSAKGLIMRSRPTPNDAKSDHQLMRRHIFAEINSLLRKIKPFIRQGFKNATNSYPFDRAKSVNLRSAVTGEFPDLCIDYRFLKVAEGVLVPAGNPLAEYKDNGDLEYKWTDNSGTGTARAGDMAMLLVFSRDLKFWNFKLEGNTRKSGQDVLSVPSDINKDELHAYIAFISKDGNKVSDSTYLPVKLPD